LLLPKWVRNLGEGCGKLKKLNDAGIMCGHQAGNIDKRRMEKLGAQEGPNRGMYEEMQGLKLGETAAGVECDTTKTHRRRKEGVADSGGLEGYVKQQD